MTSSSQKVSDDAVAQATGWTWEEWFTLLDEEGAKELEHADIVRLLRDKGKLTKQEWSQMIAVEYVRARGLRQEGETAGAGFEFGIRRTFETSPKHAWDLLTRSSGLKLWLGVEAPLRIEKGETYQTPDGDSGQILSVTPGKRVRVSWRHTGMERDSTIQLTIISTGKKATVAFHHENMDTFKEREKMRKHWNNVLAQMGEML